MPALEPLDAKGFVLREGDRVRILGIPDLSGLKPAFRKHSEPVFRHLIGLCKRIESFDPHGCAELFFTIRSGPCRGIHSVAIEPFLLLKQRPHLRNGNQKRSS